MGRKHEIEVCQQIVSKSSEFLLSVPSYKVNIQIHYLRCQCWCRTVKGIFMQYRFQALLHNHEPPAETEPKKKKNEQQLERHKNIIKLVIPKKGKENR